MKIYLLALIAAGGLSPLLAQAPAADPAAPNAPAGRGKRLELRNLGPLPDERKLELPVKDERNPFAEKATHKNLEVANGDSEDARLRAKIGKTKISGIIHDPQGSMKVQFGRHALKEGDELPRLLADQTSKLRVSKLTDQMLEIAYIDKDPQAPLRIIPRSITIGTGAYREKLTEEIMVYKLSNGETINDPNAPASPQGDATAQLENEAFGTRPEAPNSAQRPTLASPPRATNPR